MYRFTPPFRVEAAQLWQDTGLWVDFAGLGGPLYLHKPLRIHSTCRSSRVAEVLCLAEKEALAGHWVAGFLSFEAAAAFELPSHAGHASDTWPLAWFAVFSQVDAAVFPPLSAPVVSALQPEISQERYQRDIQTILTHIGAGDTYQVNYTLTARLLAHVDPATLFLAVQAAHRHPYAAWVRFDRGAAASFSPELFLQRQGDRLLTAPIKGTCARLADLSSDAALGDALENSTKDRAEHLMIVDMARNDLGKVCLTGSIRVDRLFERRVFPTVQHLETRVWGRQQPGLALDKIMAALFPAASITGAPKRRTMEIIRALEKRPRGLYTGSIGVLQPGGDFIFNVAIRTVLWHGQEEGRIGLGGGIVADSNSTREWAEITEKGRFLQEPPAPFQLIETFLLDQEGHLPFLEQHMDRLADSARCLGFVCNKEKIASAVREQAALWHKAGMGVRIVRLLLALSGTFSLQTRPCSPFPKTLKIGIAEQRVDRFDRLLRHKTTRRHVFDQALARAKEAGEEDALFFNNLGRVTEGTIRAILVRLGERWYVPPLEDGLLASTWRARMIKRLHAHEHCLTLEDLCKADEVVMGNAVQGGAQVVRLSDASGQVLATWANTKPG